MSMSTFQIVSPTEVVVDGERQMTGAFALKHAAKSPSLVNAIFRAQAVWLEERIQEVSLAARDEINEHRDAAAAAAKRADEATALLSSLEERVREELLNRLQPQFDAVQAELVRVTAAAEDIAKQRDTAVENNRLQTALQARHWALAQELMAGKGAAAVEALREIRRLELLRQEAAIAAERKELAQ